MKRRILLFIVVFLLNINSLHAEKEYTLNGKITDYVARDWGCFTDLLVIGETISLEGCLNDMNFLYQNIGKKATIKYVPGTEGDSEVKFITEIIIDENSYKIEEYSQTEEYSQNETKTDKQIGLKGLYLNANADDTCKLVKDYVEQFNKNNLELIKKSPFMKEIFEKKENYCGSTFIRVEYTNNKVDSVHIAGSLLKYLFNLQNISDKEFAQSLVDNVPWLNSLNYSSRKDTKIWSESNVKDAWRFEFFGGSFGISIRYNTISKPSF